MALLFILLLPIALIFLLYYELIWKRYEQEKGKGLVGMTGDFIFRDDDKNGEEPEKHVALAESPWGDWKYRLMVEMHRKGQLKPEDAANIAGVSIAKAETYLDQLEGEGKVQQAGDSERGIFYRVV